MRCLTQPRRGGETYRRHRTWPTGAGLTWHAQGLEVFEVLVVLLRHLGRVRVLADVVLGVYIEALGVARETDRRDDGSAGAAVVDVIPVHSLEERVLPDLGRAATNVPQPPRPVDRAELPEDVLGVGRDGWIVREYNRFLYYSRKKKRGRGPGQQLATQHGALCLRERERVCVKREKKNTKQQKKHKQTQKPKQQKTQQELVDE